MRRVTEAAGVAFAVVAGVVAGAIDAHARTVDVMYFVARGDVLLSSHWSSTFADPSLQAGPLQVGVLAALAKAAHALDLSSDSCLRSRSRPP